MRVAKHAFCVSETWGPYSNVLCHAAKASHAVGGQNIQTVSYILSADPFPPDYNVELAEGW